MMDEMHGSPVWVTPADLFNRLWPLSDATTIGVTAGGGVYRLGDAAQVKKAITAWKASKLAECNIDVSGNSKRSYRRTGMTHVALSPIVDGGLRWFAIELTPTSRDDVGNRYLKPMEHLFGAQPVTFKTRDGNGLQLFFVLAETMQFKKFKRWARSWGFNRQDRPRIAPWTEASPFVVLPSEAAPGRYDDQYIAGNFAEVKQLPKELSPKLTDTAWDLLIGAVDEDNRKEALQETARSLSENEFDENTGKELVWSGVEASGVFGGDNRDELNELMNDAWDEGRPAEKMTDLRAADDILQTDNGADLVWCHDLKLWLRWSGRHWEPSPVEHVHAMIQRYLRAHPVDEHMQSGGRLDGVCKHLRAQTAVGVETFDRDGWLLNVENGTIDLRTGDLRGHRREDRITKLAPVAWDDHVDLSPERSLWTRTLIEILGSKDMADFLARCFGYAATADQREEVAFLMIGGGGNGKSTMVDTVLAALGSDYTVKVPVSLIMKKRHHTGAGDSYASADLAGKRLAVATEIARDSLLKSDALKDHVDGAGRMTARQIYQTHMSFERTHTLFIYGNHDVRLQSTDAGTCRRLLKIPFARKFEGEGRDNTLKEELIAEHLPEVLAWIVAGCADWQRRGLAIPSEVTEATAEFIREQDQIGQFMAARTVAAHGPGASVDGLFQEYDRWRQAEGADPFGKREFGSELRARGYSQVRTTVAGRNGRYWRDLDVAPDHTDGAAAD